MATDTWGGGLATVSAFGSNGVGKIGNRAAAVIGGKLYVAGESTASIRSPP